MCVSVCVSVCVRLCVCVFLFACVCMCVRVWVHGVEVEGRWFFCVRAVTQGQGRLSEGDGIVVAAAVGEEVQGRVGRLSFLSSRSRGRKSS